MNFLELHKDNIDYLVLDSTKYPADHNQPYSNLIPNSSGFIYDGYYILKERDWRIDSSTSAFNAFVTAVIDPYFSGIKLSY